MLILGKRKHSVTTLLTILIIFISKSTSDESVEVKNGAADVSLAPATSKVQEGKSDDNDAPARLEENSDETKPEKIDQQENQNEKEEDQFEKSGNGVSSPQEVNSDDNKHQQEKGEENDHLSAPQEENAEEVKSEDVEGTQKQEGETKKQNVKVDGSTRKISLSDVNSIKHDENQSNQVKRETKTSEFLGLPRDASYFFDDLEPFINNNSASENSQDNARAARAIPARENKAQKAKLGVKKEVTDEETEEEDEDDNEKEEKEDDDGKASEGDYDDDEDAESDCQPTTADSCTDSESTECSPTTACPTTPQCTTKVTRATWRKTTTKCTTRFTCPTTCPTSVESTKCPRICAKGHLKQNGYPVPQKTKSWELDGKRMKKKFRSKISAGN